MRIYIVEDDHVILYAGPTLSKARRFIRGSNTLAVWENDVWIGDINRDGEWIFKTMYHPDIIPARR